MDYSIPLNGFAKLSRGSDVSDHIEYKVTLCSLNDKTNQWEHEDVTFFGMYAADAEHHAENFIQKMPPNVTIFKVTEKGETEPDLTHYLEWHNSHVQ